MTESAPAVNNQGCLGWNLQSKTPAIQHQQFASVDLNWNTLIFACFKIQKQLYKLCSTRYFGQDKNTFYILSWVDRQYKFFHQTGIQGDSVYYIYNRGKIKQWDLPLPFEDLCPRRISKGTIRGFWLRSE